MSLSSIRRVAAVFTTFLAIALTSAHAASQPAAAESEVEQAVAAMEASLQSGPRTIALGRQAQLALPEGYSYVPQPQAARFMHAIGNSTDESFLGLIVGDKLENGFISMHFEPAGYIKDDDARDWNADELLKNLKDGTEAQNADRRARGLPEFVVEGWVEKPNYDAATHRLVWSASTHDKNDSSDSERGVNYNTYLLGREGYLSMNLVTDLDLVEKEKPAAHELLAAASFVDGKRYADFNASTDKVAEYGLAALIGGLAVKKLGLLAMVGVFLAKAWKIIALVVVGGGAALKKMFGNRDKA